MFRFIQSSIASALLWVGWLSISAFPPPVHAQEARTPRIGLALGGGSARGLAHVGVLRWLEEHRVPVDAIAGTSTGAFIGGAYAAGLSPDEIQTMLSSVDWEAMLRPDVPFPLKSFRRKDDDRDEPIKLELGLRDGFRFQSGLNSGHRMGLLISRVAFPYSAIERFDDFATPFRCVATDIEAGEVVVIDHGPLGAALRASMSLPGTFDPWRLEGRLLADGGILNNVPVDVARSMGAEVVIAVNVSIPGKGPVSPSIQGIANRSIRLMMHGLDEPRLAQADVVLQPDVEGIRAQDFTESVTIAARGYAAAQAQSEALLRYAVDAPTWERHKAERRARRRGATDRTTFVEVTGAVHGNEVAITKRILEKPESTPDTASIEATLDTVVGRGRYSSGMYRRVVRDGRSGLGIDVREKTYAPPIVKYALNIDSEDKNFNLSMGSRITILDATGPGSEWRFDTLGGSRVRLESEIFQPIGGAHTLGGGAFVAPRVFYARDRENAFNPSGEALTAVLNRQRAGGGLDLGWIFGRKVELRAGLEGARVWNQSRIGAAPTYFDGSETLARGSFRYEGQDKAYFPMKGLRLKTAATWWLKSPASTDPFGVLEGTANLAFRLRPRHALIFQAEGSMDAGDAPPFAYQARLGGPFRLGSFPPNALRGPRLVLGGIGYRVQVGKLAPLLGDALYLTALAETGSVFDAGEKATFRSALTAGLAADTVLGPFFLGASLGAKGEARLYFLIGAAIR